MKKKIVFCNCGGNLLTADFKEEMFGALKDGNVDFIKVSDLCSLCSTQKQDIKELLSSSEETLVIACHQRAVKLLFNKTGIETETGKIHLLNFLEQDVSTLLGKIKDFNASGDNVSSPAEIRSSSEWPAWFPLIDYSRCSSCGQCTDFCLFGVYEKEGDKVMVIHPEGCKNNCPACARICPQSAIVFPKYEHGGAIAGAESIDEIQEQQRQQKDIDAILGSEIYQALEKRKLKRQSIIRNNAMEAALKEREQAQKENKTI